ncbi:nucleotide sugar dehydrogenase [Flavobacteriaceae bacterium]|nr:nucleotide sugar dehydrogenase [Flavobacteriaceae bacterium]
MTLNNICCIGAGFVGGPTMAVIALHCPEIKITIVDSDKKKINSWNGNLDTLPVYEPGLSSIIEKVRNKNLFFSNDIPQAIDNAQIIFMAVNTPTKKSGKGAGMAADLTNIISCAKDIARFSKSDKIVIEKSTLPVRTAEKIKEILTKENKEVNFEIISNPEFLAEGTAINDLFKSDRVLIGGEDTKSGKIAVDQLIKIYSRWIPRKKILTTNVWSSELAKLASNAMLAQRISSINSLSALCEKTGANIFELSKAIGMDKRIGPHFLNPSVGFGGSCFQKDILNLVYLSKYYGLDEVAEYWHQVVKINDYQKERFTKKILDALKNDFENKTVAILGWAFKKNTNDSRESASIYISKMLLEKGVKLKVFDPLVEMSKVLSDLKSLKAKNIENLIVSNTISQTLDQVDLVAIMTESEEYKNIKTEALVFDGRGIYSSSDYTIGKPK